MPKIVDPAQRRTTIAEAVFALVQRGGIAEASLRNVAAEAGLNIGSVRHYVDGQEGMLVVAVREMAARIAARIEARLPAFAGVEDPHEVGELAIDLLEELLPLDGRRRQEVVVWLAFCEHSRIAPGLQHEARELINGSRRLAHLLLGAAGAPDVELGAELLGAALDGLAIALLHEPGRLTREQVRELLRVQLRACVRWQG